MSAATLLLFAFRPDRVNSMQAPLQQFFPDFGKRTFFLFNHNILLSN
ncbi:hypothetical protein CHCC20375_2375 [Bacillus licheniformis]|nr:hypothetical protein CHCC20375_2375 [Bacillus licheniformis]